MKAVCHDPRKNPRSTADTYHSDNQAFWLRFGDTVPRKRVGAKQEHDECTFLRPDGNGGAAFYLQSTAGRLYDKWLLEQMEDV